MDSAVNQGRNRPADNCTGRVSWRGVPLADLTYSVVDLETTGLKPQGNGITEVCCLRVKGEQVVDRFSTLINPGRPIPPFIQAMTGITDAMVRKAPAFAEIIPSLLAFLEGTVLVAHNAPFDLSFLNYGLYCGGRPSLPNPVVDTLRLARKLLPELPRGSLDAVTRHLGIAVESRHRAYGDASATAAVLLRLLSLCQSRGIENDAQLLAFLAPARPVEKPRRPSRRALIAARLGVLLERCRTFPDAPGVYLMRSAAGRVLYVGKALSLRRRVVSYFSERVPSKTRRLLAEVESIEHLQLGSELEALLEESQLIKLHQPPYNVLLRSYKDYPFIKVNQGGPYPRLEVTRRVSDDTSLYFGPFRGMVSTEMVVDVLSRCFGLFDDRCPNRSEGESCLYRQMGRCLAPCLGEEQRTSYREAVEEACRLLETEPEGLVAELVRRRDAAAERLDFETAAIYRDGIDALGRALSRHRLLDPAVRGLNVLVVCPSRHPGWAELFVFRAGRLAERERLFAENGGPDATAVEAVLERVAAWSGVESRAPVRIDAESLDQVTIISSWLERQRAAASTLTLEPGWAADRFREVADWAIAAAAAAAGE